MRAVTVASGAVIDGVNTSIGYHTLFRAGDRLGSATFGQITDKDGRPLALAGEDYSNRPDFASLLTVGNTLFSLTHFETVPAAMYLSELSADAEGKLTPVSTRALDFSGVGGLWSACAGRVTPWNSHLGGEEHPPEARAFETARTLADVGDPRVRAMAAYFGLDARTTPVTDDRAVNPYHYGFPTEVEISETGEASISKHYAMGRASVEMASIMPDRRTAYISDDAINGGLFRFVADREDDLGAGQLYAAKWVQTSDAAGGAATLDWIDLGHATDAAIGALIAKRAKFSDIFETAEMHGDGSCPEGFLSSNAESRAECLKLKPGMAVAASRLETRRYASMLGATTEFHKMEGTAYNSDRNSLYVAVAEIEQGMGDAAWIADRGGRNDIRLPRNPCGAVYEVALDDAFVGRKMTAVIAGRPSASTLRSLWTGEGCDIDGIANPDNLSYIPGYDTLILAEDTVTGHRNDAVWSLNLSGGELTRIATTPYGAEATSVDWYPDVLGHGYLMLVVQHPYGESDAAKLTSREEARAYVGYIGPFPAPTQ
ncbi:MAG: alkaline phosphatase PhoX [Albidovulum sp.]